jgi:hypothetical protein
VLSQPPLVDAIRARILEPLDALAFSIAVAPRENFALDFTRASPLTDVGATHLAEALADCGRVVGLNLAFSCALTFCGVGHVGRMRSLRALDLAGSIHLDDGGARILRRLTALTALGLANTAVGDSGLECICAHLRALRSLDLVGCMRITAAGVPLLSSLVRLTSLCSPRSRLLDDFFGDTGSPAPREEARALAAVLPSLPALERLAMPSSGGALVHAGCATRDLKLSGCSAADWCALPAVAPAVTSLCMNFDGDSGTLSFDDVERVARGLPSLARLELGGAGFSRCVQGAWRGLAAASGLQDLACCFGAFGAQNRDADGEGGLIEALAPALTRLTALDVPLGAGDLAAIGRHLSHCRSIVCDVQECGVDIAELAACSALSRLNFSGGGFPSSGSLAAALAAIAAAAPLQSLSILDLDWAVDFCAFSHLTALDLTFPSCTALQALPALRGSPLVRLDLHHVVVRDVELIIAAKLAQLTSLRVVADRPDGARGAVCDAGLRALASGVTGLRRLVLDLREANTAITDAGLAALCALPRLRRLALRLRSAPAITAAGVASMELLPALLRFQLGAHDTKRVDFGET